ncbi:MAG: deoxyguanosinetriphosphate triphosphohydrolase [Oscillospiraceae bacterium]|jgi:dGTPase|nr:deoxyguanosinetriphosphate triphosphohydrolase [Oscillospiraceae bacterium]
MNLRELAEGREHAYLAPGAAFADASLGRARPGPECDVRTAFQRDRDRIIHCEAFRRLKHKTQVFLSPRGDHYRTRLTHTLEVSQIARTIACALLLNENLAEAIALGHDLGHTPFGHAGERALEAICPGGFRHYEQSRRVCEKIEKSGQGLNLTYETLDGMERHTRGAQPVTLEGQIVRLADRIAYINHDIEDAIAAGVLTEEDIPAKLRDALGHSKSARINTLVRSCCGQHDGICLAPEIRQPFDELHTFMFERVYTNPICKSEEGKAVALVQRLWEYFCANPSQMPPGYHAIAEADGAERAVCDYIAGMTDRYAVRLFGELFVPKDWSIV